MLTVLVLLAVVAFGIKLARRHFVHVWDELSYRREEVIAQLRGRPVPSKLLRLVALAVLDSAVDGARSTFLPNDIHVGLAPEDYERYGEIAHIIAAELTEHVKSLPETHRSRAHQLELRLLGDARIRIYRDQSAAPGAPRIKCGFVQETIAEPRQRIRTPRAQDNVRQIVTEPLLTLEIEIAGQTPHEVQLGQGQHTIGRAHVCTVQLQHASVSRQHAEIVVARTGSTIRDLSSRNQTLVGGKHAATARELFEGDVVHLSRYVRIRVRTGVTHAAA